MTDSTK